MTDLATMVVKLEAETSKYQASLQAAQKQLEGFRDSVGESLRDITQQFAAAFTVDKLAEFVAGAIEGAAQISKLSQSIGDSVEHISAFGAVAAQAGLSQDDMATSLKKLNQAISEAAGNPTSKAALAFDSLQFSVHNADGSVKNIQQTLSGLADAYAKTADGPNKVAANTELLGRSAQGLIPILNEGSAALDELQKQAVAAGATLSKDLAEAAEDLEKKIVALKQSFTGSLQTDTLNTLLPTLNAFADGLSAIGKAGDSTGAIMGALVVVVKAISVALLGGLTTLKEFGALTQGLGSVIFDTVTGDFTGALNALKKYNSDSADIIDAGFTAIANTVTGSGGKLEAASRETATKAAQEFNKAFNEALGINQGVSIALLQQQVDAQKKLQEFSDAIKVQADSFGLGSAAATDFKLRTGAVGDAVALAAKNLKDMSTGLSDNNPKLKELAQSTLAAAAAAHAYAIELQTKQDTKSITDYTDKLQEQLVKFGQSDVAAVDFALSHDQLGQALARSQKELSDMNAGLVPYNKGLHDSAQAAVDAADKAHVFAVALTEDKNKDALTNINQQILTITGSLGAAAAAAFDFANKSLNKNLDATGDTAGQAQLQHLKDLTVAQGQYNEKTDEFNRIRATEAQQEADINRAVQLGTTTTLDGQDQIAKARTAEIAQLQDVYTELVRIGDTSGIKKLQDQNLQLQGSLKDLGASVHDVAVKFKNDFINDAADSLSAFITGTESAKKAWQDFVGNLLSELIKLQTTKFLESLLSGSTGSGGFFTGLASALGVGGGKASGGPVTAGTSYTVGEHGAEEFVPTVDGTIVPNRMMGGSTNVHIYQTIQAPNGSVSRQTSQQIAAQAGAGVNRAVRRNN